MINKNDDVDNLKKLYDDSEEENIVKIIYKLENAVTILSEIVNSFEHMKKEFEHMKKEFEHMQIEFEKEQEFTDKLLERIIKLESGNS